MKKIINNFLDLVYPPVCGICENICKDYICKKCIIKIKKYKIKRKNIYKVRDKSKFFDEACHIFKYEDIIRDKLIQYKFDNKSYLYKTFSKIILNDKKICGFLENYDIIIPVPIHKKRKQQRGYNQTELIANQISKDLNIKLEKNILIKNINTKAQSGLNKKDRQRNVRDVFKLQNTQKIINKKILIIDDIYTTGSTLNECSRIIRLSGVKKIGILTIAKD